MATVEPTVVVEGPTFNFGKNRSGNIDTLRQLADERGFSVVEVPPYKLEIKGSPDAADRICSSSLIRQFLQKGSVKAAKNALGRPYRLIGTVIPGRGIGAKMGFPTANIRPLDQIIPAEGVYAGHVTIGPRLSDVCTASHRLPAVFSIGYAETFPDQNPLLVEAHILRGNVVDLGGKFLAMDFIDLIRPQKKFDTTDQLKDQIEKDCQQAGIILQDNL